MSSGPTAYELGLHGWDSLDRARDSFEQLRDHPKSTPSDKLDSVFLLWAIETARAGLPGKVAGGPRDNRMEQGYEDGLRIGSKVMRDLFDALEGLCEHTLKEVPGAHVQGRLMEAASKALGQYRVSVDGQVRARRAREGGA